MHEISVSELAQIVGGLKSPHGIARQPDDGNIKLIPVPLPRDGVPVIPTDSIQGPPGVKSNPASALKPIPAKPSIRPQNMDEGKQPAASRFPMSTGRSKDI